MVCRLKAQLTIYLLSIYFCVCTRLKLSYSKSLFFLFACSSRLSIPLMSAIPLKPTYRVTKIYQINENMVSKYQKVFIVRYPHLVLKMSRQPLPARKEYTPQSPNNMVRFAWLNCRLFFPELKIQAE